MRTDFCHFQVGSDQISSNHGFLSLLPKLIDHRNGCEAEMQYRPTLLQGRDGSVKVSQAIGVSEALVQAATEIAQWGILPGRVSRESLCCLLEVDDSNIQIYFTSSALVASYQCVTKIVQPQRSVG